MASKNIHTCDSEICFPQILVSVKFDIFFQKVNTHTEHVPQISTVPAIFCLANYKYTAVSTHSPCLLETSVSIQNKVSQMFYRNVHLN